MKTEDVVSKLIHGNITIVAITGAGISKASGMPTFRGEDGMWNQYQAQDLATPYAFQKDPKLVWEWYKARMRILLKAKPNNAHLALSRLEAEGLLTGIISQNVDGLHEIAGNSRIVEIHGTIRYAKCINCSFVKRWDSIKEATKDSEIPICPMCNELLRPDVVWFGEGLDNEKWRKVLEWIKETNLMMVIGTSGVVHPVASLPSYAKQHTKIIEFNTEKTPISNIADFSIFGPCESTLPEFTDCLIKKLGELDE